MRGREAVLLCFLRAGGRQHEVVDSPAVPRFSARACRGDGPVSRGRARHGAIQGEDGGARDAAGRVRCWLSWPVWRSSNFKRLGSSTNGTSCRCGSFEMLD